MVLPAHIRKQKLSELRSNHEASQGKQKLYYKNETASFDVYRIDLDWLIYNRHNGRLEAEMLTWEQEHNDVSHVYDEGLHSVIENLLWQSNTHRNEQTLKDLEDKQQQRPGIVSLDGVIIDGNRRAMLLKKLELRKNKKQYFDAIILPDAYDDNQTEIVRLETQYQLGEDSKVEYGPLQKYLHAKRLHYDLGISVGEIDILMGQGKGNTAKLLEIMELMDDYLEHIGCPKLYTMLKDRDGSKEGMFVDLYSDLKRIQNGSAKIPWSFDAIIDPLQLKLIQFDYIRLGEFSDAKKTYREISHLSKGNNFFSHKDIWEKFRDAHQSQIDPITEKLESLNNFIARHPEIEKKSEAAKARDLEWRQKTKGPMQGNFRKSSSTLFYKMSELKPKEYLERAKLALEKIDVDNPSLLSDPENAELVREINRLTFEMKKKFEKSQRQ